MSTITNESFKSKAREVTVQRDRGPLITKAHQQQAFKLAKDFASGQATLGQTVAGFKTLTESVKPAGVKTDPAISEITDAVPGIDITSSPSTKSNVDTLAGSTTAAKSNLRKILGASNPRAIHAVLKDEIGARSNEIRVATNAASDAVNDPVLQEKFKDLGIQGDELTSINGQLASGINNFVPQIESTLIKDEVARQSRKEMFALGNPYNSSATEFGPLGQDFANILGSIAGIAANTGSFNQLGQILESIAGSVDPITGKDVKPLIDVGGNTNLFGSLDKGSKLALDGPTTQVFEVGVGSEPQNDTEILYEKVNDKKEFELELVKAIRDINRFVINWTASGSDENYSAKEWNTHALQAYRAQDGNLRTTDASWQAHYYIRKDGVVERILPLETRPEQRSDLFELYYKTSVIVTLDAGHTVPYGEESPSTLSSSSITANQWQTLDMMLQVFLRHCPGGQCIGQSTLNELTSDQSFEFMGPGFDVQTYVQKFRKDDVLNFSEANSAAKEAAERLAALVENEDLVSFDESRREYVATVNGVNKTFPTAAEAIANSRT